jgi:hypothetical protein
MQFFAQADPTIWSAPSGTNALYLRLAVGVVLALALLFACLYAPTRARRYIVGGFTFVAGLVFVGFYFWPKPVPAKEDGQLPKDFVEAGGFFFQDLVSTVGDLSVILTGFLLGLGIFSLVRIHATRFIKRQANWPFSLVLLICLVTIMIIGLVQWQRTLDPTLAATLAADRSQWSIWEWSKDVLFDGLLQ